MDTVVPQLHATSLEIYMDENLLKLFRVQLTQKSGLYSTEHT